MITEETLTEAKVIISYLRNSPCDSLKREAADMLEKFSTNSMALKNSQPDEYSSKEKVSNWKLFKRSLADHPGLLYGFFWPVLVLVAILSRHDGSTIPISRVLLVTLMIGALPWIPILITAWNGRHQYQEKS